ncbi:hypothetical protein LTR10_019405 [Elasticomyces elasticus]|uniref:Folylpolyglutamate synthetase n=1 Tax=Exophiala sideris TaxID=1016849 RepID=A0ABR0IVC9_9EURO|nr:hypothetical protein LTR10_019405 [Elasticomyces elasticus]KAK5021446.1 Folylpolyglutamate synthetase [Exophiala sideris]KAK5025443.1 hypothetical protein LTR13_010520 [Exophiala sideris]KAK5049294.1 Folylpolyglutamate synthetase [Exophiala sideris]KAK5176967.1 hypothetical protein LTR44_010540 [Eurotiomycetes sp. CCFEE 6388]
MDVLEYEHTPLQRASDQIRILTVSPTDDNNSVIETRLSTHWLPRSEGSRYERAKRYFGLPQYFAISYVCGSGPDSAPTHFILIDGKVFPVSQRVHEALRVYRSYASGPICYWLDCICISQTDAVERSEQILLMRDIYSPAQVVLVWLGPFTTDSERAMQFVDKLTNPISHITGTFLDIYGIDSQGNAVKASDLPIAERIRREIFRRGNAILVSAFYRGMWLREFQSTQQMQDLKMGKVMEPRQQYSVEGMTFIQTVKGSFRLGVENARLRRQLASTRANEPRNRESRDLAGKFDGTLKLVDRVAEGNEPMPAELVIKGSSLSLWTPSDSALKSIASEDLVAMASLIQQTLLVETDYFERMWTMQEPCVAIVVTMTRGRTMIDLASLIKVVAYLNRSCGINIDVGKAHQISWIRSEWHAGGRLPLRVLLYESRNRHCSDPRDKVYSLLGLMCERQTVLVQPNYLHPISQVYANATRFLITSDRSLDVICGQGLETALPDLPSWAQDFRWFGTRGAAPLVDLSGRTSIYRASLSEPPQYLESPLVPPHNWRALKVAGILIGTVKHLSRISTPNDCLTKLESEWSQTLTAGVPFDLQELDDIAQASQLIALLEQLNPKASHDCNGHVEMSPIIECLNKGDSGTKRLFHKYLLTLLCGRTDSRTRCNIEVLEAAIHSLCNTSEISYATAQQLSQACRDGMCYRRLCILEGCKLWGATPNNAMIGDCVFVVLGCSVPVVLRKLSRPGEYRFIGEGYFDDFMDGEALKLRDQGISPVSELNLR